MHSLELKKSNPALKYFYHDGHERVPSALHYLEGWRLQMHAAAAILAETTTLIAVSEDDLYKLDPFADENLEDNETVIDEN